MSGWTSHSTNGHGALWRDQQGDRRARRCRIGRTTSWPHARGRPQLGSRPRRHNHAVAELDSAAKSGVGQRAHGFGELWSGGAVTGGGLGHHAQLVRS
jgi:hypothetical protein